jgi:predicted RNA-binding Zn ribbon-like protein
MDADERDLLLQFLWTRDAEDTIDTPEKLKTWLVGLGLLGSDEPVSEADVRLARHFRAATRSLCAANNGMPLDERTNKVIAQINDVAPLKVTVRPYGQLDVEPGGTGVPRALSSILAVGYKATVTGEFPRFKACKGCGWAYYDESKNSSRRWCDMGVCGSKTKVRAFRERQKAAKAGGDPGLTH